VNRAEDRQIGLGKLGSDPARASWLVFPRRAGDRTQFRPHRLATANRPSASPACWPAPLAGHGLVTGLGGGAPASGSAADSGAGCSFGLSGALFLCFRPSIALRQPLALISGLQPGRSGSSARRGPSGKDSAAQRGGAGKLKRQLGIADHPVLIPPQRDPPAGAATFTSGHARPVHIANHCIARFNGGGAAATGSCGPRPETTGHGWGSSPSSPNARKCSN